MLNYLNYLSERYPEIGRVLASRVQPESLYLGAFHIAARVTAGDSAIQKKPSIFGIRALRRINFPGITTLSSPFYADTIPVTILLSCRLSEKTGEGAIPIVVVF